MMFETQSSSAIFLIACDLMAIASSNTSSLPSQVCRVKNFVEEGRMTTPETGVVHFAVNGVSEKD
ncbi:hypothetical protein H5410_060796 [Solanum commersonii]|uniref:Uncharacterized protein n=1 Tax=Solanum commersonii TaxID=4109 RepID=A0A9J5W7M6_SOLCO|nr:hypothetical protein H5410_060796 [Solanum commersonii]